MRNDALVCFSVGPIRFALPVGSVDKIIRAVAIIKVPEAKPFIYGVMDFHGEILPVINMRARFGMPVKEISVDDRFLIIFNGDKRIALVADSIDEVKKPAPLQIVDVEIPMDKEIKKQLPTGFIEPAQFLTVEDGLILIYDVGRLLGSEVDSEIVTLMKELQQVNFNG
jgi:chemotaxis signal transduction protein